MSESSPLSSSGGVANRPSNSDHTPSKRPRSGSGAENSPSGSKTPDWAVWGRYFVRQGDSFRPIKKIVAEGIKSETEDTDDERPISQNEQRDLLCWKILCDLVPGFRQKVINLVDSGDAAGWKLICREIQSGMNKGRADDSASLKSKITSYLLANPRAPSVLKLPHAKYERGWENTLTATLLCPIKYPATTETFMDIKAGTLAVTAEAFPRFLYPDDHEFDPDDLDAGILRGHLMIRVAKHILQGPSAALEGPGYHRGKHGLAALAHITSITPHVIGYVAIQARFGLSSATTWSRRDGLFDYEDFFWNIIRIFDHGEGQDILDHFNYHIFGTRTTAAGTSTEDQTPLSMESDFDRLRNQRAAKRAQVLDSQ